MANPPYRITKRVFEDVACIFNDASRQSGVGEYMRLHLAVQLAKMFGEANPRFDRTKFLLACGAPGLSPSALNKGDAKRGDVTATVNPAKVATPANDNKGA